MATQERYYNGETRTCNLCDDSTVSYRPTKKLKHLMHHVAKKQFIDDVKFDENKKIFDPNSHFQFVEGRNFVVYRQKVDPDVITGATEVSDELDFDSNLQALMDLTEPTSTRTIIQILGNLHRKHGIPLPTPPTAPQS
ncbi:hypothetical protein AaE_013072 [Aphanomyces astaci]|uniref:Uncharacterized protein n=1 Tax=Aphanomyces astaci TaxID=112090 RepID=A0A6A4Z732_APHAT|nr:hypothetical protein AaE_013072 [Aphanomyces astaci]